MSPHTFDDGLPRPLPERPLKAFLTYRVASLNSKLNRQAGTILRRLGNLKLPEWRIIAVLSVYGELSGTRIGEVAGLDPGLVSRTFQALERRGLIEVRRSDQDRRVTYAKVTDVGYQLTEQIFPVMRRRHDSLLEALDEDERKIIFTIMDKLYAAASVVDFPEAL